MSHAHMFDSAFPPDLAVPGFEAVAGYVGGNTPHVWTLEEWHRFRHLRQLPIWVGFGEEHPENHAREAVRAVKSRGWKQGARHRRWICLDFETEIDKDWVNTFADDVWLEGYATLIYGSLAFVWQNIRRGGHFWVAAFNGFENVPPGAVAHQYAGNVPFRKTEVDLSVLDRGVLRHLGEGPRF